MNAPSGRLETPSESMGVARPALLRTDELAVFLGVPRSRVYEWTRAMGPDAIPCYQGGRRVLFDAEEALAWFKRTQRREGPNRRVPDSRLGGQRRREAVRTAVFGNGVGARALGVPKGGV